MNTVKTSGSINVWQHIPVSIQVCCVLQGYLAPAMVNYLSLLGWNDGSEKEIYSVEELQQAFTLDRITKSPAVFDKVKLAWMNGQHLRSLPGKYGSTQGLNVHGAEEVGRDVSFMRQGGQRGLGRK
jgi:glutamyl/glutaminyl-tRNA synthetase